MSALENRQFQNSQISLGQLGRKIQIGSGTITADEGKVFVAIVPIDDVVLNLDDINGLTLLLGTPPLFGRDKTIEVVSGSVIAYMGV